MTLFNNSEQSLQASWMRNMFGITAFSFALYKLSMKSYPTLKYISLILMMMGILTGLISTYVTFYINDKNKKYKLWKYTSQFICLLYSLFYINYFYL